MMNEMVWKPWTRQAPETTKIIPDVRRSQQIATEISAPMPRRGNMSFDFQDPLLGHDNPIFPIVETSPESLNFDPQGSLGRMGRGYISHLRFRRRNVTSGSGLGAE